MKIWFLIAKFLAICVGCLSDYCLFITSRSLHSSYGLSKISCKRAKQTCCLHQNGPNVVVVGGGWAGLGAAYHLSGQGYNVTVLDAAPNAGGAAGGIKSESNTSLELGIKGFWFQVIWQMIQKLSSSSL